MDNKEKMLFDVLRETGCDELPNKLDGVSKNPWVYAIGETIKCDGSTSYVILRCIDGENYRIFKDYGTSAKIVKMQSIRPYMFLYPTYLPCVKTREDIVRYIVAQRWEHLDMFNGDPEFLIKKAAYINKETPKVAELDNREIRREFYKYAIEAQVIGLKTAADDRKCYISAPEVGELIDIDGVLVRKEVAPKIQQLKEYQNKVNGKDGDDERENPAENAETKKHEEVFQEPGNTQIDQNESKSVARRVRKVGRKN